MKKGSGDVVEQGQLKKTIGITRLDRKIVKRKAYIFHTHGPNNECKRESWYVSHQIQKIPSKFHYNLI